MEFKTNRENITASECIYSGVQEQGVELDYILPDYYPDIFRLVRCELTPVITGYSVSGDKLTYELRCDIRILYCSENGSLLQAVEQRQNFSKTVDLGKSSDSPEVKLVSKTDHVNFRAVNKRRLDLRGAVSVKVSVMGETSQEIISDASGMNIQLKKSLIQLPMKKINTEKTLQLAEDIELSEVQPTAISVVNVRCRASECEQKLISGKLLAKGDVNISLLYAFENDGGGAVEPMEFSLSYSQIVDIDGLDDSFECSVCAEIVSCEVTPTADKDGSNRIIRCETEVRLVCKAVKTSSVMLVTDAFSTVYPCETVSSDINAEQSPVVFRENFRHSAMIVKGENIPQTIYSMWCTPKNINSHLDEDGRTLVISGMLTYSMAAKDSSGMIAIPDKDETFEQKILLESDFSNSSISAEISVNEVSYNITSSDELSVKADISANITVFSKNSIKAVTDIAIDENVRKQRDGDYAIKLYFGIENESVWDIAKRYSTDVNAIIEENEIEGDTLTSGGMLLIPIVS